ncbi:DUF6133 family protein [Paenibacillus camerounensis]|uniref:DUF6133 family protein n=1 Tax=Paenibacillus camerounensis TaxID=1243663 RepID=UPI0005A69DE2|nr:DUF6133 family protein [Paenibacillus camerounensis]
MKKVLKTVKEKSILTMVKTKHTLCNRRGEGFVDTAVKILISIVIGALLLAGLYLLFNGTILPTLTQRIKEMFNYKG